MVTLCPQEHHKIKELQCIGYLVNRVTRYENEKLAKLSGIGPLKNLKMATNWPIACCIFALNLSFLKYFTAVFMIEGLLKR